MRCQCKINAPIEKKKKKSNEYCTNNVMNMVNIHSNVMNMVNTTIQRYSEECYSNEKCVCKRILNC